MLDLDKGYEGAVLVAEESEIERADPSPLERHETVARMAAAYMRKSGTAMREMKICERTAPTAGQVAAKVVAKDEPHVALASAPNNFFIVHRAPFVVMRTLASDCPCVLMGVASLSTIGGIEGVSARACTGPSQQTLYRA